MSLAVCLLLAAQSAPLTMPEAITQALAANEDARAAELAVVKARASRREVWSQLFGDLSVRGTYTRRAFEIARDFENDDGTVGTVVLSKRDALFGIARMEATIFDATVIPQLGAAADRIDAAKRIAEQTRRTLAFEVADAFLSVLAAERTRDAALRRSTLAEEAFGDIRARFDAGLSARSVLNRSKLELATARLEATRAENATRQLRLSLGFLLARTVDEPLAEPQTLASNAPVSELLPVALEERPDLAALRSELEARRSEANEPWLRFAPTLGVAAEATATNEPGFTGRALNWSLSATAIWSLWDGGARYAIARRRAAEAEETALDVEQQERRVALELSQAATDRETAIAAVEQAEAQLEIATENAEEVRARFSQGLATAIEQADAAVTEFDAAQALARERFEADAAALRLLRAMGAWPSDAR